MSANWSDQANVHPRLGTVRQVSIEPHICSLCCEEIPEDTVPLMLFAQGGNDAWVYCDTCSEPIMRAALADRKRANP